MNDAPNSLGVARASGKPLHLCPNCSAYEMAITRSERLNDRCVRNAWSCDVCGFGFETSADFPDATRPSN
jgi:predicted RNA-binding Zn-ribbon protein involved in translation (DUF1610 family)